MVLSPAQKLKYEMTEISDKENSATFDHINHAQKLLSAKMETAGRTQTVFPVEVKNFRLAVTPQYVLRIFFPAKSTSQFSKSIKQKIRKRRNRNKTEVIDSIPGEC